MKKIKKYVYHISYAFFDDDTGLNLGDSTLGLRKKIKHPQDIVDLRYTIGNMKKTKDEQVVVLNIKYLGKDIRNER